VLTGVLESLSRDDGRALIQRHGGKVTFRPSKRTSHVVFENNAGSKKLEIIRKNKIRTIDEDGLFELIKTLPADGRYPAAN